MIVSAAENVAANYQIRSKNRDSCLIFDDYSNQFIKSGNLEKCFTFRSKTLMTMIGNTKNISDFTSYYQLKSEKSQCLTYHLTKSFQLTLEPCQNSGLHQNYQEEICQHFGSNLEVQTLQSNTQGQKLLSRHDIFGNLYNIIVVDELHIHLYEETPENSEFGGEECHEKRSDFTNMEKSQWFIIGALSITCLVLALKILKSLLRISKNRISLTSGSSSTTIRSERTSHNMQTPDLQSIDKSYDPYISEHETTNIKNFDNSRNLGNYTNYNYFSAYNPTFTYGVSCKSSQISQTSGSKVSWRKSSERLVMNEVPTIQVEAPKYFSQQASPKVNLEVYDI